MMLGLGIVEKSSNLKDCVDIDTKVEACKTYDEVQRNGLIWLEHKTNVEKQGERNKNEVEFKF